jgi:hypothetical protein
MSVYRDTAISIYKVEEASMGSEKLVDGLNEIVGGVLGSERGIWRNKSTRRGRRERNKSALGLRRGSLSRLEEQEGR